MVEEALQSVPPLDGAEVVQHHGDEPMVADLQGAGHDLELAADGVAPLLQGEEALALHNSIGPLGLQHRQHRPAVGAGLAGSAATRAVRHMHTPEELPGTVPQGGGLPDGGDLDGPVVGGDDLAVGIQDQHQAVQGLHKKAAHGMSEAGLGLQNQFLVGGPLGGGKVSLGGLWRAGPVMEDHGDPLSAKCLKGPIGLMSPGVYPWRWVASRRSWWRDRTPSARLAPIRAQAMSHWVSQGSPCVPRKASAELPVQTAVCHSSSS